MTVLNLKRTDLMTWSDDPRARHESLELWKLVLRVYSRTRCGKTWEPAGRSFSAFPIVRERYLGQVTKVMITLIGYPWLDINMRRLSLIISIYVAL